jgi:hypothetical protein
LGVSATELRRSITVDGTVLEREGAEVLLTLEGRALHTICLFGREGDLEVLGAYTLEGFGLAVDAVQRRLIPAILYGAAAVAQKAARRGSGSHYLPKSTAVVLAPLTTTPTRSPRAGV